MAEQLKLTNLDADVFLVNVLAPLVSAWGSMLIIILAFLLHFSDVTIKSAPTSLLVGLPSVIRSHALSKRTHTYLLYEEHKNAITSIAWSSDGKHIISTSSDQACIWEAGTGNTIFTHSLAALSHNASWKPSGIHIVSSSQNVRTLNINNTAFSVSATDYTIPLNSTNTPIWSPNYKYMAFVLLGSDDTIQICDASDGQVMQTYRDHTAPVLAVAWSPNGEYIASGGKDKTVRIWNAITGTHIYTYQGHEDAVRTIAWSADSKQLATGSLDHTVHIWQATTGNDVFIYRGHTAAVLTVAWSPDGKQVASGSHDKTARVWNTSTGKEMCLHNGHRDDVLTVQWSPNGRSVASGSADTTIHVWDVPKSKADSKSSELHSS
ncbi:MAG TPA: WD40 repeat domain-containing protein [Ktedonobacteraceae bacterium]|nr:WD40 repeat domain-containing protein [Ktedonobacteraceae bacterium]